MTVAEFAEKHSTSRSRISDYCKRGIIIGAAKNEKGIYIIPDNAKLPYVVKKHKNWQAKDIYKALLNAISRNCYADYILLHCERAQFDNYLRELLGKKMIKKSKNDKNINGDWDDYILTMQGVGLLEKLNAKNLNLDLKVKLWGLADAGISKSI